MKRLLFFIVLGTILTTPIRVAFGLPSSASVTDIKIVKASIDASADPPLLTLYGRNFDAYTPLSITVGGIILSAEQYPDTGADCLVEPEKISCNLQKVPVNSGETWTVVVSGGAAPDRIDEIDVAIPYDIIPSSCIDGHIVNCYTGPQETLGVGICEAGYSVCQSGEFGACINEVLPTQEICGDGLDNDCDGEVDEGVLIGSIDPPSAYQYELPIDVAVFGSGFEAESQIFFDGESYATSFIDESHLTFTLTAGIEPGAYLITVVNPNSCSGSYSSFFVAQGTCPVITEIIPTFAYQYELPRDVLVYGSGFEAESQIFFGGELYETVVFSTNILRFSLPAAIAPGTYDVTVVNPGGCSYVLPNAFTLEYY